VQGLVAGPFVAAQAQGRQLLPASATGEQRRTGGQQQAAAGEVGQEAGMGAGGGHGRGRKITISLSHEIPGVPGTV